MPESAAAADVLAGNLALLTRTAGRALSLPVCDGERARATGDAEMDGVEVRTASGGWASLHSRRAPLDEARQALNRSLAGATPSLIAVIGLGAGYLLDAIHERLPGTRVLAFEPDPSAARLLLARRDLGHWLESGRLRLLLAPDYAGASEAWRLIDADGHEPVTVVNPVLERERASEVAQAREVLTGIVNGARANAEARRQLAGRYLLNTVRNLPHVQRSAGASALFGQLPHVPAIVLGAGPSLDAALDTVRRTGERALLLAVDTALGPLLEAGIEPHLVIAADPQPVNARHLTTVPRPPDTWLVAEGSLDPAALTWFTDRAFFFAISDHQPWPWLEALGIARSPLRIWGSVATSAFDLALRLGCDPIVFAGMDLAFTDGRPYCRNTIYEKDWAPAVALGMPIEDTWRTQRERHQLVSVPDVHGDPTETAPHLIAFRDWLVEQAAAAGHARRIINATGRGILKGSSLRQEPLDAVLAGLPVDGARGIRDWLAACHARGRHTGTQVAVALERLEAAAAAGGRPEPLATWRTFTAGTVSHEEILQAVGDALATTRRLARDPGAGRPPSR